MIEITELRYKELLKAEQELKALPYWQPFEDEALLFGVKRGHNRKEIAHVLGKTTRQISRRLYLLGERGLV